MTAPYIDHDFVRSIARTYAEGNMIARVRIVRMADAEIDVMDSALVRPVPARLIYEGRARVYTVSGPSGDSSSGEPQAFSSSNISTPLKDDLDRDVVSQVDDLVEVLAHDDPLIVGLVYRVLDVDAGGQWPVVRRHMVSGAARFKGWTWAYEPVPGG